jgi:septal ring factor EnvC (AmiA/AmiB activator)
VEARLLTDLKALPAAALAGLLIMFFAWSCERQARQRDTAEAEQVKKQSAADISRLQQQAAGALRDAKQSAEAVQRLESERQQLARQAEGLQQRLASLHQQELAHASEVAALSSAEVTRRVASRLQGPVSGAGGPVSGQGSGPASNASHPSAPALVLSDKDARKVETTFLELDSCRQQRQVVGQQVANCEQQAKLASAVIDQQSSTIAKLNAALADKDQVLARSEEAHRAELRAARGTLRSRFFRAVEYCAAGFIVGVLVR